jgi:glutamate 5-kinase
MCLLLRLMCRRGRKRWILSVPVRGEVWLDEGAQRAVQERKKSLFSAGILNVKGEFEAQVRAEPGPAVQS